MAAALTADWCLDAAMNLPLLFKAADEVDGFSVCVFRKSDLPAVESHLNSERFDRIPVVMFFEAEGREIGRFMERPRGAVPRLAEYWQDKPNPKALFASGDERKVTEARELLRKLASEMQQWYQNGLWRETVAEWLAILAAKPLRY